MTPALPDNLVNDLRSGAKMQMDAANACGDVFTSALLRAFAETETKAADRIEQQAAAEAVKDAERTALKRALFMCAAHCQGGHSEAGMATAKALGLPFPLTMKNLEAAATRDGLDPRKLWPWLFRMRAQEDAVRATQERSNG